jgi:hypothetical protein
MLWPTNTWKRRSAQAAVSAGLLSASLAWADPGYYLVTVYEDTGKVHLDYRYWTVQRKGGSEVVWPEIGIGYNVTNRWYTELLMSYVGPTVASSTPSTLNWQNDFLLTQGQWDVDIALHTLLVRDQQSASGNAVEFGPMLQTDVGRVQLNGNLIFEKSLAPGNTAAPQLKYQWQAKYRWSQALHTGVQGFGELGTWNRWLDAGRQSHRWGPVVGGAWTITDKQRVEYQAAYLMGSVYGNAADMLSLRVQLVF